jgi:hypothetical protein
MASTEGAALSALIDPTFVSASLECQCHFCVIGNLSANVVLE